jgi:hypothetical protein
MQKWRAASRRRRGGGRRRGWRPAERDRGGHAPPGIIFFSVCSTSWARKSMVSVPGTASRARASR